MRTMTLFSQPEILCNWKLCDSRYACEFRRKGGDWVDAAARTSYQMKVPTRKSQAMESTSGGRSLGSWPAGASLKREREEEDVQHEGSE
jgi:hypothetical protein